MSHKGDRGFEGFFPSSLETVTDSDIMLGIARKAVDKEAMPNG